MQIPGYSEAVAREQRRRDRAWLGIGTVLFDRRGKPRINLRPLTYRTYLELGLSDNACLDRSTALAPPADVFALVWLLCDLHRPGWGFIARLRRRLVHRRLAAILTDAKSARAVCAAIDAHLVDAFADTPTPVARAAVIKAPRSSHMASIATTLRRELQMNVDEILDMPLGQLWQFLREIHIRADKTAIFDDESERIKREWLIHLTARAKEGRSHG